MADRIYMEMEGVEELRRTLRKMGAAAIPIVRKGMRAGGRVLLKGSRARAPKKTGTLRKAHRLRVGLKGDELLVWVYVTGGKSRGKAPKYDAYYASMVERGTSTAAAKPYMRPAFDEDRAEAIKVARERILSEIDKIDRTRDFPAPVLVPEEGGG